MTPSLEQRNSHVRPAAVANAFYPGDSDALARTVDDLLAHALPTSLPRAPKALVVPHAGYVYSGPTAAMGFKTIASVAHEIRRVVVLGPAHRVPVRGCALPESDSFATPLGVVPVDQELLSRVSRFSWVVRSERAHATEHSLEVELPFLQRTLGRFSLLPIVVGIATPQEVATLLDAVWGGDETLIVISSDLSHYLSYDDARALDSETARRIVSLEPCTIDHDSACGATPVNGLLIAARARGLVPTLLDLRNSGDTAGTHDRVVGYTSIAFHSIQ